MYSGMTDVEIIREQAALIEEMLKALEQADLVMAFLSNAERHCCRKHNILSVEQHSKRCVRRMVHRAIAKAKEA